MIYRRHPDSHHWVLFLDCGGEGNIISDVVGVAGYRQYRERRGIWSDYERVRVDAFAAEIHYGQRLLNNTGKPLKLRISTRMRGISMRSAGVKWFRKT